MQSKFEFPGDSKDTWLRIIRALWRNDQRSEVAASYLSGICPVSYDELIEKYDQHATNIIGKICKAHGFSLPDLQEVNYFISQLKGMLNLYSPNAGYSISLSASNSEMLMWSHYASSHTGYCLIFRPLDGFLHQCPQRTKDSLSVSQDHKSSIGTKFKLEVINYENELESIDAFSLLPSYHTGYELESEEDHLSYHKTVQKQLLTKNKCWGYEEEVRILLPQPSRWISGQSAYSKHQRLFHYDFNQVVGIIFGARMREDEKLAIKEIMNEKLQERVKFSGGDDRKKHIFDFLYQQAEICSSSRGMKIADKTLVSMGTMLEPGTPYYERQLTNWKAFKGITVESGQYSYDAIP
ncbi:DUF2971 domain-containing protein [Halopseudomonas laoshanensis]|uniref:DUF2971 domain-containing protein n=1 Tax=Halopseudomonas laoshanensis TaxID=2268758 RepID=UPI0037362B02